jgi:uncharacterized protein YggE
MKRICCLGLLLFAAVLTYGQIGGNQVFGNRNENQYGPAKQPQLNKLFLSDSTFIIEAKILKNVAPDFYIAVFGLSEQAKSVSQSNTEINKRIGNFIRNLKKAGIKEADIYTDIITQHRVYDLAQQEERGYYEEYLKGFSLNKNVIVKYRKADQIEQMLLLAAQDSIFDLVKVDYMVEDVSKVYDELFTAASEIIKKKRGLYLNLTGAKIKPAAQIYGEDFATYYPINQYKSYTAFSETYFEHYDWLNNRTVKKMPKPKTFYYDKPDYSGFDKIINPAVLEPDISFALTIQVKYELAR